MERKSASLAAAQGKCREARAAAAALEGSCAGLPADDGAEAIEKLQALQAQVRRRQRCLCCR